MTVSKQAKALAQAQTITTQQAETIVQAEAMRAVNRTGPATVTGHRLTKAAKLYTKTDGRRQDIEKRIAALKEKIETDLRYIANLIRRGRHDTAMQRMPALLERRAKLLELAAKAVAILEAEPVQVKPRAVPPSKLRVTVKPKRYARFSKL